MIIVPVDNFIKKNSRFHVNNVVLSGTNQPSICVQGVLLLEKQCGLHLNTKQEMVESVYRAYAFDPSLDGQMRLLLYREELDKEWHVPVFNKYLVPIDKRDVQRFDHVGSDKYNMFVSYAEFLTELSEMIWDSKYGFYLNAMELMNEKY